jgi:hypothetical protein
LRSASALSKRASREVENGGEANEASALGSAFFLTGPGKTHSRRLSAGCELMVRVYMYVEYSCTQVIEVNAEIFESPCLTTMLRPCVSHVSTLARLKVFSEVALNRLTV